MRAFNVRTGHTYRVHIPRRDRPIRYLTHDPQRADVDIALTQLYITHVTDFDITVTAVDQTLGEEPAVTGIRVADTARIRVPLDPEIAEHLGLDPAVDYEVDGLIYDAATGHTVPLPAEQELTVPVRWLHPSA